MIKSMNLNFDWKFTKDFKDEYLLNDYNDSSFEIVNIPHNVQNTPYNNFNEKMYQFVSCYRKSFTAPADIKGKALILEFEAVAHYAEVYLNGELATTHKGGYTAFSVDITNMVIAGEVNVIVVKVDSTERADIPPFGNVIDFLCYGGIYREVYLHERPSSHITKVMVVGKNVMTKPIAEIKLAFTTQAISNINGIIRDKNNVEIASFLIDSEGKNYCVHSIDTPNIELWDINNPAMYTLELTYNGESIIEKFGYREAIFKSNGFFLNGKPLKIVGLNRHQCYPYVGYAMPASAQIADADYLKFELGLNLARTSHYPNSKHFLNRCDEIGLLVFTEIPGWQFVSADEEWRKVCLQNVREMITEAYNHPSIILWGVRINESKDDNDLYTETNKLAHSLDESRQTGGVRCFPRSKLLEDVYTYNDFSHSGNNGGLMPKFIVCGNVPLLITEHNGHMFPTKTFDHEKKRQEHLLRHANVLNTTFKRKNTAGAIGWCMSDYNTHKDFGSGDKICYHGVSDMFRNNKLAAYLYKSQQDKYPVLELTSNMEIGDNAGGQVGNVYMITNCDSVNLYKNGELINTFDINAMKKSSKWNYLPHPPIELFDIIGNQLEKNTEYNFTKHGANRLKKFLLLVKKFGTIPAIMRMPHTVVGLMIRYGLGIDTITYLFGQYVTNWGDESISYKLEGIKNGKSVTTEKAAVNATHLFVKADSDTLIENDTYDTTRIAIMALSQANNILPYSNDVVTVTANGDIDIIGDTTFALIGGMRAVWVKSRGKSCNASVTFTSSIGTQTIEIQVIKK